MIAVSADSSQVNLGNKKVGRLLKVRKMKVKVLIKQTKNMTIELQVLLLLQSPRKLR